MVPTDGLPIVIVSGLPRSGTSLMMQMLQQGGLQPLTDGIREADDDNPRGYYELEAVKRTKEEPSWLNEAGGRVVKVIYKLLYDLPTDRMYRVIFMRRDLAEILASQAAMLERRGPAGSSLPRKKMMSIFEKQLADILRHLHGEPCFEFIEVDYKRLVENPVEQAEAVNQFLGGVLQPRKMIEVIDADLYRQRA